MRIGYRNLIWKPEIPIICCLQAGEQETWCIVQPKKEGRQQQRAAEDGCTNSKRKGICPSFIFLFYLGLERFGWCPFALVRGIFFTQFTDSDANLFGDIFTDTPRNHVLTAINN